MGSVLQGILVGLIVAGSVVFSAWRLMSPSLRLRVLSAAAPMAGKVSPRALARLRERTLSQLASGCSACSHKETTVHRPGARRG